MAAVAHGKHNLSLCSADNARHFQPPPAGMQRNASLGVQLELADRTSWLLVVHADAERGGHAGRGRQDEAGTRGVYVSPHQAGPRSQLQCRSRLPSEHQARLEGQLRRAEDSLPWQANSERVGDIVGSVRYRWVCPATHCVVGILLSSRLRIALDRCRKWTSFGTRPGGTPGTGWGVHDGGNAHRPPTVFRTLARSERWHGWCCSTLR